MEKDTSEIVKELGLSQDFQTFYNENKEYMVHTDLAGLLTELLQRKGLKKSHVIKNAEISEIYGYQIFSGVRVPLTMWLIQVFSARISCIRASNSVLEICVLSGLCQMASK